MAVTCTYGGLNLNDGTKYIALEGFDPGEKVKTWDERRGLNGTVAQYNVTEASLIELAYPLRIKGTSLADFKTNLDAINNLIDAGAQSFVYNNGGGSVTYNCVHSQRLNAPDVISKMVGFAVDTVLILMRTP